MASFASTADMAARSNGAIPADRPFLQKALDAASARIRNYCGWHISTVESVEDLRVRATPGQVLWLPTTYLTAIDAISINGVLLDEVALAAVDFSADGRVDFTAWAAPTLISFTHGYTSHPDDLVALTLELATGELQSAGGAIREQSLTSSVTWARASGRLTDNDKADLAIYKIGYQP